MMKTYSFSTYHILLLLGVCLICACESDPNADIAEVELEVEMLRTDSLLYECARALQEQPAADHFAAYEQYLKSDREFLLAWIDERAPSMGLSDGQKDSLIVEMLLPVLADSGVFWLLDTVRQTIPYDEPIAERLSYPLKRFKKYLPQKEIPALRTHVDGYVPQGDVRAVDQVMSLPGYMSFGLHYFMGPEFPYYPVNVPQFIRRRFSMEYLEVVLAHQLAHVHVKPPPPSYQLPLVDRIVYAGIKQYMVDQLLPNTPDSLKLFYTAGQMEWADYFEANIYHELLNDDIYSVDIKLYNKYLADKPHSTHLSLESAPRLGVYVGWKIVSAYMERHPEVSLAELIERTDYEAIFRDAKYKP